jgi:hypothetical protein
MDFLKMFQNAHPQREVQTRAVLRVQSENTAGQMIGRAMWSPILAQYKQTHMPWLFYYSFLEFQH